MKKWWMTPLLAAGACAACCALPLLPTLLAGLLTSSLGVALIGWQPSVVSGLAVVLGLAFGASVWVLVRRRRRRPCPHQANKAREDISATSVAHHACGCRPGKAAMSRACC